MKKTSKEILKEFVNSQHFTSTTDIMNSMGHFINIFCISGGGSEDNIYYEYYQGIKSAIPKNN